ncbi:MAG: hypothetical protein ACTHN0_15685 [Aquihabitans sp.]
MGIEVGAFIEGNRLPRRELWQAAIEALDLPVELPASFDPSVDVGSQPFTFLGDEVGVEVGHIDATDREGWAEVLHELGRSRRKALGARDTLVVFRWGGEAESAASGDAAVAALAVVADAVVWDLEADELLDPRHAVALARQVAEAAIRMRDADRPLTKREAERLWQSHLVPAMEDATGRPVTVHGWDVVVGRPGWFAHVLHFDRARGLDGRAVKTYALVPQLYAIIHPTAVIDTSLEIGKGRPFPDSLVSIPTDPGPRQEAAMADLVGRLVDEALPHFARLPDLDALITANEQALTEGTSIPQYTLDALAGGYAIRGDVDRASTTYHLLFAHIEGYAERKQLATRELQPFEQRLRQRGFELQDLVLTDRPAVLAQLAEQARRNADEAGIGPIDIPPA